MTDEIRNILEGESTPDDLYRFEYKTERREQTIRKVGAEFYIAPSGRLRYDQPILETMSEVDLAEANIAFLKIPKFPKLWALTQQNPSK